MKLAYTTYGMGCARLVIYRDPKEGTSFVLRNYTDAQGKAAIASFEEKAPMILVGPSMLRHGFLLEAWRDSEGLIGTCEGEFEDGLRLSAKSGYFEKTGAPRELIEHETISAAKSEQSAGLRPTDIVLLSRKWEEVHQLVVKAPGMKYWDDSGITEDTEGAARRVTGWSLSHGAITELHCALVSVLSGSQQGHVGYLLWGDDGGIRVGGAAGEVRSAAWVRSADSLTIRARNIVQLPPYSVTQRHTPISLNRL